jgi:hypothetical protein
VAAHQKGARRAGRGVAFLDESGFMLQPVVRRTWAPRGRTPVLYSWDRHDRISAISAVTLAPRRNRLGLYFDLDRQNIRTEQTERFLVRLRRRVRRDLVVIWDRWNVHRAVARRLQERFGGAFRFEWLPAYAPDLNPVEGVWRQTKHADLANLVPEDADDLGRQVDGSLRKTGSTPALLRGFFRHAGLPLEGV